MSLEVDCAPTSSLSLMSEALPDLTCRERDVGQMLGQRLSNREISEQLVISVRTAECHVGRVIAKLGAANRREAGLFLRS